MTTKAQGRYLSTLDVARRFGVQEHHVRRLFALGHLPEPPRIGARRVILEGELPKIEAKLRELGWLK